LGDCSRATGFIQPVHDGVMPGCVDGLQRGPHAPIHGQTRTARRWRPPPLDPLVPRALASGTPRHRLRWRRPSLVVKPWERVLPRRGQALLAGVAPHLAPQHAPPQGGACVERRLGPPRRSHHASTGALRAGRCGHGGHPPAVVRRGAVRLVAGAAPRIRPCASEELVPETVRAWQELRQALETRRHQRILCRRCRQDSLSSLAPLEADFLQLILPP
jgi:hypothetical protein